MGLHGTSLKAQITCAVTVTGHDRIVVTNTSPVAADLLVDDRKITMLPAGGSITLDDYSLSDRHVAGSTFRLEQGPGVFVALRENCRRYTGNTAQAINAMHDKVGLCWAGYNCSGGRGWLLCAELVAIPGPSVGCRKQELIAALLLVAQGYGSCDETLEKGAALIEAYRETCLELNERNGEQCLSNVAAQEAHPRRPSEYPADELIPLREQGRSELALFVPLGLSITHFDGRPVNKRMATLLPLDDHTVGLRYQYDWAAYRNGRRLPRRNHVAVSFTRGRTVQCDTTWANGAQLTWDLYTAGFGCEYPKKNRAGHDIYSFFFDVGVIGNSLTTAQEVPTPGGGTLVERRVDHLHGFSSYLNLGLRIQVCRWMGLHAAWRTSLYYQADYDKANMPRFSQFEAGLSFVLHRRRTYQF